MYLTASIMPAAIDWTSVVQFVLVGVVLIFAVGAIFRAIFGKGSTINCAVSATLSILMVYLTAILLFLFAPDLIGDGSQLPFLTVSADAVQLWNPSGLDLQILYSALVKLGILAILVNILETFLPDGKKFWTWYLWRCVTAVGALASYVIICGMINTALPQFFGSWAGFVLIGFWALILLTGVLKVLLSIALTVVNPIIGALYTFFFSNMIGKQFSKSILTTVLAVLIISGLNHAGLTQFAFADFSLITYGPACVIVVIALYLFGKLL